MLYWISYIALLLILGLIFVQDWKDRAVHWWLFPILLGLSFIQFEQKNTNPADLLTSFIFLVMVLLLLIAYISLRRQKWVNIFKNDFGWGDVLFLLAVIPLFSHKSYILFFISGMFFSLLIHLLLLRRKKSTVPLAGYLALYVTFLKGLELTGFQLNHHILF